MSYPDYAGNYCQECKYPLESCVCYHEQETAEIIGTVTTNGIKFTVFSEFDTRPLPSESEATVTPNGIEFAL